MPIGKYSKLLIEHFTNPRNLGVLEDYDLKLEGFNESDGDKVLMYIKLSEGVVSDIKFKIKGCPRAIASTSFTSEVVKGMAVKDILKIDEISIYEKLEVDSSFECIPMAIRVIKSGLSSL